MIVPTSRPPLHESKKQQHWLSRSVRLFSSQPPGDTHHTATPPQFQPGDKILVEIVSFGPLGASVDVIGHGSHSNESLIPESDPPLGQGMILQEEIAYFRQGRNNVDVVRGEILPAYVASLVDGDLNKINICLRPFGGKAKTEELIPRILEELRQSSAILQVGDKSSPGDIARMFPGVSKGAFKKAVGSMYREGLIEKPEPQCIRLKQESS